MSESRMLRRLKRSSWKCSRPMKRLCTGVRAAARGRAAATMAAPSSSAILTAAMDMADMARAATGRTTRLHRSLAAQGMAVTVSTADMADMPSRSRIHPLKCVLPKTISIPATMQRRSTRWAAWSPASATRAGII